MKVFLPLLLNNLGSVIAGFLTLLGLVLGAKAVRRRRVAVAIYHAFHIVEDLQAELGPSGGLDKVLEGLKAADSWLKANGWRPLKEGEEEVAKLTFKSLNAQADAQVAVVTGALASPK